jgi:hypothetical protein
VLPGTYSVRLNVNGQRYTQPLTIVKDPRSVASDADLKEQFDFLMRIRDKTSQANDAVKTIRNVKAQLADREKRMSGDRAVAFSRLASDLSTKLSAIEGEIYQVKNQSSQDPLNYPIKLNNKIAALAGVASGTDARPTSQTREVYRVLSGQLDAQLAKMRSAIGGSLASLNAQLKSAGLAELVETSVETPSVTSAQSDDDVTSDEPDDDDGKH